MEEEEREERMPQEGGRINQHLENLLKNSKRENDLQRNMAKHYFKTNQIARSKLQKVKTRLETLAN